MRRALLIALLMVGCGNSNKTVKDTPIEGSGSMNKKMGSGGGSQPVFVKGAALSPGSKLVEWMETQKRGSEARLLRLVVVLPKGPMGYDIAKARLGTGTDALEVYANDSALGVGLGDRAETACKGSNAPTCAFKVEGYWRGQQMGGLEFDVMKAEFLPPDEAAKITHAEVEGESGN